MTCQSHSHSHLQLNGSGWIWKELETCCASRLRRSLLLQHQLTSNSNFFYQIGFQLFPKIPWFPIHPFQLNLSWETAKSFGLNDLFLLLPASIRILVGADSEAGGLVGTHDSSRLTLHHLRLPSKASFQLEWNGYLAGSEMKCVFFWNIYVVEYGNLLEMFG